MQLTSKLIIGVAVIIGLFLLLSPFADPNPDGLEKAVGDITPEGQSFDLGFFTDYGNEDSLLYHFIGNSSLSTIISGLVGVLLVIGIFSLPLIIAKRRKAEIQS